MKNPVATTVDEIMQYVDRHRKHELNELGSASASASLRDTRIVLFQFMFAFVIVFATFVLHLCAAVLFVFVICTCLSQTLSHDVEWFPSNKLN